MSTGRKSQLEKFEARQRKARGVSHHIEEQKAKEAHKQANKTIQEKGVDVMKKTVNPNATTEDVFMVIARDSMEAFTTMWNNSMQNVIRETIRTEVKAIVKEVVAEELQAAVRGVQRGISEAMDMRSMVQQAVQEALVEDEDGDDEPAEGTVHPDLNELRDAIAMGGADVDGDKVIVRGSINYPPTVTCGNCGQKGHNRRTCPSK